MSVETISRRYGTALADVVLKSGETETVKAELKIWEQLMTANSELQSAFGNPAITHPKKEKVLEQLIARTQPSRATANFLRVLLRNGRLMNLGDIMKRFELILEERSGIVSAEVASARELSEAQRRELKVNLEKRTGRQVKIDFAVNPELIGGVVTRIGSTVYDGSVKTKLENLREELVNG
jgi:F-type H+-transporting ATPase subunit delta